MDTLNQSALSRMTNSDYALVAHVIIGFPVDNSECCISEHVPYCVCVQSEKAAEI